MVLKNLHGKPSNPNSWSKDSESLVNVLETKPYHHTEPTPTLSSRQINESMFRHNSRYITIGVYIVVWSLLIHFYASTDNDTKVIHNSAIFFPLTQGIKIFVSTIIFVQRNGCYEFVRCFFFTKYQRMLVVYMPIAALYSMNNIGKHINHHVDPSQYKLDIISTIIVILQMSCGVVASMYNERLLKNDKAENLHLQNICLHINMIIVFIGERIWRREGNIDFISEIEALQSINPVYLVSCITLFTISDIMNSVMLRYESTTTKVVASTLVTSFISSFHYTFYGYTFVPHKIYAIYLIRMSIVVICSPVKFLTKQIVQSKRRMRSSSLCEASRNLQMSLPRFTKTLTLLTFVLWSNLFYDIWSEEVCKLLQWYLIAN
jgi:hypothetical protein